MPELTRRRDPDAPQETWLIHYGDVRVGVIAERVGNPDSTPGWHWTCGFYPGSDPSEHARGIAKSFEQARGAFEIAWRHFLVKRTEADFEEYRRDRAFHAWKQGMWAAGLQLHFSCRRRLLTVRLCGTVPRRSASRIWMPTSTPCTWSPRQHEISSS